MKRFNCTKIRLISVGFVAAIVLGSGSANVAAINQPPIADAGLPLYTDGNDVVLDGTKSFDPDNSGVLQYNWQQVSGPVVVITDSDTATPTVSGFVQTDLPQLCEFQLIVNDGQNDSLSDTAKVWILATSNESTMIFENEGSFNPDKPTIIFFDGGNCINGGGAWNSEDWEEKANIFSFSYFSDGTGANPTYYKCGDLIIKYLSTVAPNYNQPIQTMGKSSGGMPAIDVGIRINLTYADARYAINRVTFLDALRYCRENYSESISTFLGSSVDGEQCWADSYVSTPSAPEGLATAPPFEENVLNVGFPDATGTWPVLHILALNWYRNSLVLAETNNFNHGAVAGTYLSVIGPGKNLQLVSTPGEQTYKFNWHGDASSGYMDYYDEPNHPGRLPEPVTLLSPVDVGIPGGAVLTSQESENAVGYQLLFGSDPDRVMDYEIVSDTPTPPNDVITTLPFEATFWTVRVYDQHGSTIYADPLCISTFNLSFPVENQTTGKKYGNIQGAIDEADAGDEIVLKKGTYHERIDFKGKILTVRSTNPNDPDVVAETIINGGQQGSVITLSGSRDGGCLIDGLTIIGGTICISCRDSSLTIRNCTIESNGPVAIEFWYGYEPIIIDCTILGQVKLVKEPRLIAHWRLDETKGDIAEDSEGEHDGIVNGDPLWQPTGGMIFGALQFDGIDDYVSTDHVLNPAFYNFSVFAWVKGGAPGQVIISQVKGLEWLSADPSQGNLKTGLKGPGRLDRPLVSQTAITDGDWHRVGLTWDGSYRILFVDDIEVARDTNEQSGLPGSEGGFHIGAGNNLKSGSFWSGLIDDVRIYNRAVIP